jgi:hypothetical protein
MSEKSYVPRWSQGITATEWRRRLLTLSSPVREAAARIIWWETLSLRPVSERSSMLDDMLRGPEVPNHALQAALIRIGLPSGFVMRRISEAKPRVRRKRSEQ